MTASTSRAAYLSIAPTDLEEKVLGVIVARGSFGATVSEIQEHLDGASQVTVSPRIAPLEAKGLIFRAGDTRPGPSGRQQRVLRAIEWSTSTPIVMATKKAKLNPFLAGMIYATRVVLKEPDLLAAKLALKRELLKAATR